MKNIDFAVIQDEFKEYHQNSLSFDFINIKTNQDTNISTNFYSHSLSDDVETNHLKQSIKLNTIEIVNTEHSTNHQNNEALGNEIKNEEASNTTERNEANQKGPSQIVPKKYFIIKIFPKLVNYYVKKINRLIKIYNLQSDFTLTEFDSFDTKIKMSQKMFKSQCKLHLKEILINNFKLIESIRSLNELHQSTYLDKMISLSNSQLLILERFLLLKFKKKKNYFLKILNEIRIEFKYVLQRICLFDQQGATSQFLL